MRSLIPLVSAIALATAPAVANAATVLDPAGDFAPGYTAAAPDLDVRSFTVNYNPTTQLFSLTGTLNGAIDPATGGFYIIGVNTGTGPSAPFAALGAPNVRFNQVVRVNKDGTASLGSTPLTATIAGSSFSIDLLASLFPSTGFTPEQYGFNLWPRGPNTPGSTTTFVTDFAPDNGLLAAVPEPATWAMLVAGFGLVGGALRRRKVELSPQLG
jgi:hypothetical protein